MNDQTKTTPNVDLRAAGEQRRQQEVAAAEAARAKKLAQTALPTQSLKASGVPATELRVLSPGVQVRTQAVEATSENLPEVTAVYQKADPGVQSAVGAIILYASAMNPKKGQTNDSISRNQVTLYQALKTILSAESTSFRLGWAATVAIVKLNLKGAFYHTARARGTDYIAVSAIDVPNMNTFKMLLELLATHAKVGSIEQMKGRGDVATVLASLGRTDTSTRQTMLRNLTNLYA